MAVISLASAFLWPVWARSHAHGDAERGALARRFSQEMLRLSMYGSLNADGFPEIAERLGKVTEKPVKLRAVGR